MSGENNYIDTGIIEFKSANEFLSLWYKKGFMPSEYIFEYKEFKLSKFDVNKHITDKEWHHLRYDGKTLWIDDKIVNN